MSNQVLIVGLGQFGTTVARALADRHIEVLAVDKNPDRVRIASAFVTEAAAFDATDAEALAKAYPERRDVCLCAIGDDSKESSIICTALLRQMGAPRVVARANSDVHARILSLVGAHEVVNPEREYGEKFARKLAYDRVLGELPLGSGLMLSEVRAPVSAAGKTLVDLALPRKYGLTVVAHRASDMEGVSLPDPRKPLREGDVIMVVGEADNITRWIEANK